MQKTAVLPMNKPRASSHVRLFNRDVIEMNCPSYCWCLKLECVVVTGLTFSCEHVTLRSGFRLTMSVSCYRETTCAARVKSVSLSASTPQSARGLDLG